VSRWIRLHKTSETATKWGVRGFTQGLREEAASSNIRVSAVLPGGVDTAFWHHALPGQVMLIDTFLQPRQVADAVVSLLMMTRCRAAGADHPRDGRSRLRSMSLPQWRARPCCD
jgi:NAD(P)-dependent dehydrogenase (short-subunit alcohol dehydrogenase family)